MGVPQKRERVFFVAQRNGLNFEPLKLSFNLRPIPYAEIEDVDDNTENIRKSEISLWPYIEKGDKDLRAACIKARGTRSFFSALFVHADTIPYTITASGGGQPIVFSKKRYLNSNEHILAGSFPSDYDFGREKPKYVIGMSVPPVMTAHVAYQIYLQWLK
jgi:DNA (cytosine-5)-methyltransferase 1